MQNLFKIYNHFHLLTTDGRTDGRTYIVIIVQTQGSCNLRHTVDSTAVCYNMEVLLLFIYCLLLLPLFMGGGAGSLVCFSVLCVLFIFAIILLMKMEQA